eukprot:1142973-Pelagomonas_calceolata.AAC.2
MHFQPEEHIFESCGRSAKLPTKIAYNNVFQLPTTTSNKIANVYQCLPTSANVCQLPTTTSNKIACNEMITCGSGIHTHEDLHSWVQIRHAHLLEHSNRLAPLSAQVLKKWRKAMNNSFVQKLSRSNCQRLCSGSLPVKVSFGCIANLERLLCVPKAQSCCQAMEEQPGNYQAPGDETPTPQPADAL